MVGACLLSAANVVYFFFWTSFFIRIILDLVKNLMIKISETGFTQRFDNSTSSFSSEKRINLVT